MAILRFGTKTRMSEAVVHSGTVYLCGQVAKNVNDDIRGQTVTTLENIEEALASVGSDKSKLLAVTIYIADMVFFDDMNRIWDAWVEPGCAPARVCVEAKMADSKYLIEMSVVAAL